MGYPLMLYRAWQPGQIKTKVTSGDYDEKIVHDPHAEAEAKRQGWVGSPDDVHAPPKPAASSQPDPTESVARRRWKKPLEE